MGQDFDFSLDKDEQIYLKSLAKLSILGAFRDFDTDPVPSPITAKVREHLGAFVTLTIRGRLRGCIGNVQGQGPLFQTIWDMARAAAFNDPRFPALAFAELAEVAFEISVLSAIEPCPSPDDVEVGKHGLIMQHGSRSGLLLPQVPVEHKWSRETFLAQTCVKAGLPTDAWQDKDTNIFWFQAVVF